MNKKAYSFSGWKEGILLSLLFIGLFGAVISTMNEDYNKNYQIGLGEQTDGTQEDLKDYQQSASDEIKGGEAEFTTVEGLTLKSSWKVIKSLFSIIADFITGGFIEKIVNYMHLDPQVAIIFRIMYLASVILSIIYILFKVKP